ncbi:hypothetical protein ABEW34_17170 [Paenibacillus algorifonticola]|uniref:hypothetical protein n=1 Tax=Paenibacillus algorifonticola TaxID=684063 RepID=UPI003D29615A
MMNEGILTIVVGAIVSVITGVMGYLGGRSKDRISDRELLSKDEQAFRAELRAELLDHKEEIQKLSQEIVILRKENMELVTENRLLNAKVEQLVNQLSAGRGERINAGF